MSNTTNEMQSYFGVFSTKYPSYFSGVKKSFGTKKDKINKKLFRF